ncbi:4-hydroxy-tetrahydrodipicolinate synthase [Blochmannia endosymbiont of Camponotus (Colobopsis) obliquus]|uniref:4-hydroxy-tetrahydrodipicolinate synthase n=1 Tax=Blochmannia endosymbiont of Camponotus (Colobopsis) obliquus TaxID=1505597 RepID=UPI00061A7E78|nr:4-hydroxy-tetrahydrodipicolinate synthase [Blochmannia endosymbiont of Camponotus (Colobopsis) obliquus]AKC60665.1 dihydrodipicolinate synthase [Blochmannia endosymbiont of Camponotus (Colobopsis) obliquus]
MFTGSIVALVTPMDEKGDVDQIGLKKLVDYHVTHGTSAIVAVGTTGEMSGLTHKEHIDVVMRVLDISDGRIPIIAGTGANSTSEAILLTRCFNNTKVVGCLSVTPYYNKPNQEGLFQHFKAIAENSDLPQVLYNVPARTGCDILPDTIARLSEIKNIIGIKEATGDLNRVNQIRYLVNDDFILLSGDDVSALDFMQLGGQGVVSVTANVAAQKMRRICALAADGNFADARYINNKLMFLHKALFIDTNPMPVKWACKFLGLIMHDTVRLPLTSLSFSKRKIVEQALIRASL